MKIEDNFLNQAEFDKLQTFMMTAEFPWFYNSFVVYEKVKNNQFQFTHGFYRMGATTSPFMERLVPTLEVINALSIYRIKANLRTRTHSIEKSTFHVDISNLGKYPEKLKHWTTAIFYMNTNNGYTEFEDGTKVESVANRMVTFPANLKHRGTSCTDEKIRVVINFNYFK